MKDFSRFRHQLQSDRQKIRRNDMNKHRWIDGTRLPWYRRVAAVWQARASIRLNVWRVIPIRRDTTIWGIPSTSAWHATSRTDPPASNPELRLDIVRCFAKFQTMKPVGKTTHRKKPADFRAPADVFKALSNANRLLILDALREDERCVADLTALVGLDISTVSSHLAVLRGVGLVTDERRGTQVFYTLKSPCILKIFHCMEEFRAGGAR